jgi:tetratricopeptide (TPR) repeat protein
VLADVLKTLGQTYISLGKYEPAETELRAALDASLQGNGEANPTTAGTMGWLGLALAYQNKPVEGVRVSQRAVELQRQLHPLGHEDLGVALYSLGANLIVKGDPKRAEPLLQESSELIRLHLGSKNGYYMATLVMLGRARADMGNASGAESSYRQAIDIGQTVEARYRVFLAQASVYLGLLLSNRGDFSEAEARLREAETLYSEIMGESMENVGDVHSALGTLYFKQTEYKKAAVEFRKALDQMSKSRSRENPFVVSAEAGLGASLTRSGKAREAEPLLREALQIRKQTLPAGDVFIHRTEGALGESLTLQKRYQEAEPLLTSGYAGLKAKLGDQHQFTLEARARLAGLYQAWKKPEEAARYRP